MLASQEITSECFQWHTVQLSIVAFAPKNMYNRNNSTYSWYVVGRGSVHGSLGYQYLLRNFACDVVQFLHDTVENLQPGTGGGGSNRVEPEFLNF